VSDGPRQTAALCCGLPLPRRFHKLAPALTRKQQRSGTPYRLPLAWLSASRREHVSSDAWRGANPLLQVAGRTERVWERREGQRSQEVPGHPGVAIQAL
jgi:hypothetical protein